MVVNPEDTPASGTVVVAGSSDEGGDYLAALRSNAPEASG